MAKVSNASTAPPAPARTTRQTTRSQSAEPASAPEPKKPRGRKAQNKSGSSAAAPANRRGKRGEEVQEQERAPVPPELTIVEEDEDEDEDELEVQDADDFERGAYDPHRASVGTAMSGTTAKTSFSADEIEELKQVSIVNALPKLARAVDELLLLLAPNGRKTPPETWKDIRSTGSDLNEEYDICISDVRHWKPRFGSHPYISPKNVLKALLGVESLNEIPGGPWRPDNILYKANLAQMLDDLLIVCDASEWTTPTGSHPLERLHIAFPNAIAGREFSSAALAFYLELSARLAISRMEASIESEPSFSPHGVIDNLFFDDEGAFRHMEELGLDSADGADREQALLQIRQTVNDLKMPFQSEDSTGATAANGRLKSKYRWDSMQDNALRYYEIRVKQLDQRIARAGGAVKIKKLLKQEFNDRADLKKAEEIRATYKRGSTGPRVSFGRKTDLAALAAMAKNEVLVEPNEVEVPVVTVVEPVVAEPVITEPVITEPEPDVTVQDFASETRSPAKSPGKAPVRSGLQASSGFQAMQRQRQNAQRPRRFIDPQPNAVREVWSEDVNSQPPAEYPEPEQQAQHPYPGTVANGKRRREEVDDEDDIPDPTQDEGFQADTRDMALADQRRKEITRIAPKPTHRASSATAGPSNYRSSAPPEPGPSPAKRQRRNPGSAIPASTSLHRHTNDEGVPPSTFFAQAKVAAKQDRLTSSGHKLQQARRPWTEEEENALIDLIGEHAHEDLSWSALKAWDTSLGEDAKLSTRSAEDLRFKARNMKVTMLLARLGLPDNWDRVVLGRKEIDKVRSRGIVYDQDAVRAPRTVYEG